MAARSGRRESVVEYSGVILRTLKERVTRALNRPEPETQPPENEESIAWCSRQEIERHIAEPPEAMRAMPSHDELILMRRAEMERIAEEEAHELPMFWPCLCCTLCLMSFAFTLLLLFMVPSAHEFPDNLYPRRTTRRSTTRVTTPRFLLGTDATEDLAVATTGGDVFAETDAPNVNKTSAAVVIDDIFDRTPSTDLFPLYD